MNTTTKDHVERALDIEHLVPDSEKELYLRCLNNKPMSTRTTNQEIKDGCVLINHVYLLCSNEHPYKLNEEKGK